MKIELSKSTAKIEMVTQGRSISWRSALREHPVVAIELIIL